MIFFPYIIIYDKGEYMEHYWIILFLPIIFILFAIFLTINTILEAPRDAAIGIVLILIGLPFYRHWKNNE